ncbi:MAG: hypothetical protein ACI4VW_06340 [Acutalibacteraceae bacterium]
MKILMIAIICLYIALNITTSKMLTAKEMKNRFIDGQCIIGKIAANIFYCVAWLLKGIKFVVMVTVK